MKKALMVALMLCLSLTFTACGTKTEDAAKKDSKTPATTEKKATETKSTEADKTAEDADKAMDADADKTAEDADKAMETTKK